MNEGYFARLRRVTGFLLSVLVVAAALLVWLPSPSFGLWMAHFVSVELGRPIAFCGLAAALALSTWRGRWPALLAALLVLVPGERTRLHLADLPPPAERTLGTAPTVTRDVALSPEVTADLYTPAGAGPFPLVVVVHGGSWHAGEKGEVPHVSMTLARLGAVVADVHYRLAPAHAFPTPLADVKCAVGVLRARPDVDPNRVHLLGRSAGGHLALMAALTAGLPDFAPSCPVPDLPVRGVAAMYPTTDLVYGDASPPWPDPIDNRGAYLELLGFAPSQDAERAAAASPVKYAARATNLRVLLIHGEADRLVPVEHSARMAAALRSAGYAPELHRLPGVDHGFDHHPGGPTDAFALDRIAAQVFEP
jgi:acetyl esterase/lipase